LTKKNRKRNCEGKYRKWQVKGKPTQCPAKKVICW
jgi:hypothetical protein